MSDFFTRLTERTLGQAQPVQPLIATKYAPGPDVPFILDNLVEEQELPPTPSADPAQALTDLVGKDNFARQPGAYATSNAEEPNAEESIARTSQDFQKTAGLNLREAILPRAVSEVHTTSRTTNSRVTKTVTTGAFAPARTTAPAEPSAEFGVLPSTETPHRDQIQPTRAPSLAPPARRGEPAAAHSFPAPAIPDSFEPANQSARHVKEPHAASVLQSAVRQEHLEVTTDGTGVFAQSVLEPAIRRAAVVRPLLVDMAGHGKPIASTNESVPPVVRVTIGRIEVRAILPPTPAAERPAPTRTSPVLSLDAYLKQQNEAKR